MLSALAFLTLVAPAVPNIAIGPDVQAEAKPVEAPIVTVTVFSDRAQIIRRGLADVGAGITVLRLPDLPPAVSPTSLVAKVAPPARILRVEAQVAEREALELEKADALLDRYDALSDELAKIDAETELLSSKVIWFARLTPAPYALETQRQGHPPGPLAPEAWTKAVHALSDERDLIRARTEALVLARREKQRNLDQTREELGRVSPTGGTDTTLRVVVVVESPKADKASVELGYTTVGATWRPAYDLRYTAEDAKVAILSYGVVSQSTGEPWDDVELRLSTAIPNQSIELPKLMTWTLGEQKEWIPVVRPASAWPPASARFAPPIARASSRLDEHRAITMSRLAVALSGAGPGGNGDSGLAGGVSAGYAQGAKQGIAEDKRRSVAKHRPAEAPMALAQRAMPAAPPPPPPAPSVAMDYKKNEVAREEVVVMSSPQSASTGAATPYRQMSLGLFELPPPPEVTLTDPTLPAVLAGGFDYVYTASTKMSVSQEDGEVRAPLGTFSEAVDAFYRATPGITDTAYLTATVTNKTGRPFLAGPISLFLGTSFAGDAEMTNTGPGGKLELPMGADEDIKLKRRIIPATETSGVFSKDDITTYKVEIEAANFKKKLVKVEIVEPMPKTANEKIEVELVGAKPKATPDEQGMLRWTLSIAPGKVEKIELTYRVKRPAHWQLLQR
ncbi:MAG: DUF4139 domain-containing protein [Myxococcota bacterium]